MEIEPKKLADLLIGVDSIRIWGDRNRTIQQIQFDSRKVEQGDVFVAVKGTQVDGHQFIEQAVSKGAQVIVTEEVVVHRVDSITYVQVNNSAEALGILAANYYEHPSQQLTLIGVTGTNGKTTTVNLLYDLFTALGYKTGLLSTIQNKIGQNVLSASHTTPDALQLQATLADMVEAKCDYAFMEVSSHAIHQRRIAGTRFAGAVFTNITHDHLDYHGTFLNYINAKKRLFDDLGKSSFALVNMDDKRGEVMLQNTIAKKYTFGLKRLADFKGKILENSLLGLHLTIDDKELHARLIGDFNAYNLLAAYGVATLLQQEQLEVLTALSGLQAAEGRFDYVQAQNSDRIGIVDYAHTPDALLKVLQTIQQLKSTRQVVTVVGCGGDRDRAKRPLMAGIAAEWSDQVIFTSDNPRSEKPEEIIEEMEVGVPREHQHKVLNITNRRQAIRTACKLGNDKSIILVAGKGHEKYQDIKGIKHPFDDKQVLKEAFES